MIFVSSSRKRYARNAYAYALQAGGSQLTENVNHLTLLSVISFTLVVIERFRIKSGMTFRQAQGKLIRF